MICSEGLLYFFGSTDLPADEAVRYASSSKPRARTDGEAWAIALTERADLDQRDTALSVQWSGELLFRGKPKPLDEWADVLSKTLHLFAFLADRPMDPLQVYANDEARRVDYYASWQERAAPTNTVPLFTLGDVNFDAVVAGWLALLENANEFAIHVADYQSFRRRRTIPDQALWLFRCLELYHDYSDRFESRIRPKADHKALIETVLGSLPEELRDEHKEWIRSALWEGNRKRLVEQVRDILNGLGAKITLACGIDSPGDLAATAKNTRNHYTHPTGPAPADVPEGRDLVILVNRLWFVVRACVLTELGFDPDQIAAALERSSRRHYLLA